MTVSQHKDQQSR